MRKRHYFFQNVTILAYRFIKDVIRSMKKKLLYLCCLSLSASAQTSQKDDFTYVRPLFDFQVSKPVFSLTDDQQSNPNLFLRYYSLSGYKEGVPTTSGSFGTTFGSYDDKISQTRRLYKYNVSLQELIVHFFNMDENILLEVKDPSKYRYLPEYGEKEAWMRKNAKCFELVMPIVTVDGTSLMDSIVRTLVGVKCNYELRKVPALVLLRTSKLGKFKSKGEGQGAYDDYGNFYNVPFSTIGGFLKPTGKRFVDETGFKGMVDLTLKVNNWKDLKEINKNLKRYDLILKEEMREFNMFVIREVK